MKMNGIIITALVSSCVTLGVTLGLWDLRSGEAGGSTNNPAGAEHRNATSLSPPVVAVESIDPEDLGRCKSEAVVRRRIRLTNTTGRPIELTLKSKSCGCTEVKFDKTRLGANESAVATMEVRTSAAPGTLEINIVIEAATVDGDPRLSQDVRAAARYQSSSAFEVVPSFSVVREYVGAEFSRTIHLHAGACRPLKVTAARADADWIRVEPPEFTDKPEGGWVVRIHGIVPALRQATKLTIETECEDATSSAISVLFDPIEPWHSSPGGIAAKRVPGVTIDRVLLVERALATSDAPSAIRVPDSIRSIVTAEILPGDQNSERIRVRVREIADSSPVSASGVLEVLDKQGRVLCTIPVGLYAPTHVPPAR